MDHQYKSRIIKFITSSLDAMSSENPDLSKLTQISTQPLYPIFHMLTDQKIQERPFAYEFYHQMRNKEEEFLELFKGCVAQGEVNKTYQHIHCLEKCPDFIIHRKGSEVPEDQLVVLEFKLSTNPKIKDDLEKLADFRIYLGYQIAAEVLIGSTEENESALSQVLKLAEKSAGNRTLEIDVIVYDTTTKKSAHIGWVNFKRNDNRG